MPITTTMLIAKNEEYIEFLEDKLTNNTLTDKQIELVLKIQKLMLEQLDK